MYLQHQRYNVGSLKGLKKTYQVIWQFLISLTSKQVYSDIRKIKCAVSNILLSSARFRSTLFFAVYTAIGLWLRHLYAWNMSGRFPEIYFIEKKNTVLQVFLSVPASNQDTLIM